MKVLATGFALAAMMSSAWVLEARAETIDLVAEMSGALSVPPNDSAGTGEATATYDTETRLLVWSVSFEGLSGPLVGAHIHGPAAPDSNAGIVVGFDATRASPLVGSRALSVEQASDLLEGLFYVNLHTALHPGGEIRGHLVRADEAM